MNKIQRLGIIFSTAFFLFATQTVTAAVSSGHVVVAKSGGNYTTISAAMAAIIPSATNPYVIEVWPGTYTEQVSMKSYVHLKGSGANVTTIKGVNSGSDVVFINGQSNIAVSGFTITGGYIGIDLASSSSNILIENNVISNNAPAGISSNGGSAVIRNNIISGNLNNGISSASSANTITGNTISGSILGISDFYSSNSTISENTITGNGTGIYEDTASASLVRNNKITGNTTDVSISSGTSTHISYNIYNTITVAGTKVGQYNLKSDGSPAP